MTGFLRIPLIKIGFAAIEKWLVTKINFLPLRSLLESNLNLMSEVADKLTDADPNNAEQLKAVWEEYKDIAKDSIIENTIESIRKLVKDQDESDFIIDSLVALLTDEKDKQEALAYLNEKAGQMLHERAALKTDY